MKVWRARRGSRCGSGSGHSTRRRRRAFASWSPHEAAGITTALKANLEVGFEGPIDLGFVIVKTGNLADMILVDGNPLERIENTQAISGVMLDGKWMDRAYLDGALKKLEK